MCIYTVHVSINDVPQAKIRCNLNDISYLSETQKNNFQFLNELRALERKTAVATEGVCGRYTGSPPKLCPCLSSY